MSVVACCSLFDGVILAADSRVTVQRRGREDIHMDCAQKLFPLTNNTAIGFVGSLDTASKILREIYRQIRTRRRVDPISLSSWLPRILRTIFLNVSISNSTGPVAFMVASTIRDRPNVVERDVVAKIMKHITSGQARIKRSYLPDIMVQILRTDPKYKYIAIPGTSANLVYTMQSPDFHLEQVPALQFAAIGSGGDVFHTIAEYQDMIVASEPGNSFIEADYMRHAIRDFLERSKIQTVGGLYPMLKISKGRCHPLGFSAEIPLGGNKIALNFVQEKRRWVQRNLTTGKELELLLPWEIDPNRVRGEKFDDFLDAWQTFCGKKSVEE